MPRVIHVLDALPELAEHLQGEELVAARAAAVAVEQEVGRGEWSPDGVIVSSCVKPWRDWLAR